MNMRWSYLLLWAALTSTAAAVAVYWQWSSAQAQFERDTTTLHRTVSQRVDQHDAHLTALSALVASVDEAARASIKAVSANIAQFYPRIVAIDVVALQPQPTIVTTQRNRATDTPLALITRAVTGVAGRTELVSAPEIPGRYLLVKRVPSTEIRHVVSLEIDARKLVEVEGGPAFSRVALLATPGDAAIYDSGSRTENARPGTVRLQAEKVVASSSQPLHIVTNRDLVLLHIVPWSAVASAAFLSGGAILLLHSIRRHRLAALEATLKAQASAQEARLAHASRINAMGELAIAIAHELAQPLAALLSQSQAGLRMLKSGKADQSAVVGVLEANARLSKRAGDLLSKLRGWVSVEASALQPVDLNRVISEIAALNRAEFAQRGIELQLNLAQSATITEADPVGIEQVVQNLIANARDASTVGATVTISTQASAARVGFTVADEGPGIAPEIASRLFEPFLTSKPHGMGLGLSISRRLLEKFGGSIRGGNRTDGCRGAVMIVELPARNASTTAHSEQTHDAAVSDR